jgi:dipeptidase D
MPVQLVKLKGGSARNAIARDGSLTFAVPAGQQALLTQLFADFEREMRAEYSRVETEMVLTFEPEPESRASTALSAEDTQRLARFIMALPHGVMQMSSSVEGFVETSTNLAMLWMEGNVLKVITLQRSTVMSRLDELNRRVEAVARLASAQITHGEEYPAWQPDVDSPLLKRSVELYESLFDKKPEVKMIHAGLECGILSDRCGGLDMISIGPNIHNVHSPDEKLYLPSVERVWRFVAALLDSMGKG